MRLFFAALVCCSAAFCQQPSKPAVPRMTDPQIQGIFTGISQHAGRMEPMLQQVHPADWVAKGASETYLAQWNTTMEQLHAIQSDMAAMGQHPDQLVDGMKALFRVEAWQKMMASLMEGLRRYQNPAMAELIESVAAEDQLNLDHFQQYLLELSAEREQQYQIVDHEAQRCRSTLNASPTSKVNPH